MITIATHNGSFHSDDVFAIAAFRLLLGKDQVHVMRVDRNEGEIMADYVVDVGGVYDHAQKRYDHHQNGAPVRDNGIPYAGFGLMWRHYGATICQSDEVAAMLDRALVQPVDAPDNGMVLSSPLRDDVRPVELYQIVNSFAPPWGSEASKDDAFMEAVEWAESFLERMIQNYRALLALETLVKDTYQLAHTKQILQFPVPVPAEALIPYADVHVVISPDDRSVSPLWRAAVVRKAYGEFENRVSFPEAWGGLRGEALRAVSGIDDALFCHKARFLFVAGSRESALKAASLAQ